MSAAKKLLISIVCATGLLAGGLGVLVGTQGGLQIIQAGLEKFVSGFKATSMRGSLLHLKAEGLEYVAPGIAFKGNLSWDFDTHALLAWRIRLVDFELSEAQLEVRTADMSPSAAPIREEAAAAEPQPQAAESARLHAPLPIEINRLALTHVKVDMDENVFGAELIQTQARWEQDRVLVEAFTLQDSFYQAAPTQTAPEQPLGETLRQLFAQPVLPKIPAVAVPVDLTIKSFNLTRFTFKSNPDQVVDSLCFALAVQDGRVLLENLTMHARQAELAGSLMFGLDARHEINLTARVSTVVPREAIPTGVFPQPEEPTIEEVENFYSRLKSAHEARLKAIQERRVARRAQEKSRPTIQTKNLTKEERRELRRKSQARLKRRIERWRDSVRGMLPPAKSLEPVAVATNLSIAGALGDVLTLQATVENVPGVLDGRLVVRATPSQAGLPLQAEVAASELIASGATVKDFRLELNGKIVDYAVTASAFATYPIDEQVSLTAELLLKGKGTASGAQLDDAALRSNIGLVQLDGGFDWNNGLSFAASLHLTGIDTTPIMPQMPIKADGGLAVWGSQNNGVWIAKLQDFTVLGELGKSSLALTGAMQVQGNGKLEVPELDLVLGNNSLHISGQVDIAADVPKLDIKTRIDAPDFSLVSSDLTGSVKGDFTVSGTTSLPLVNADLTARNLSYQGTSLKLGRLNGRMRSRDVVSGNMTLELNELHAQGFSVRKATIHARGNELRHQVNISADGAPVSVQAKINGMYERMLGNWAFSLAEFKTTSDYGAVTLEKPWRMAYVSALKRINLGSACFAHHSAKLCLQNTPRIDLAGKSDTRLLIGLEKFDLAFLQKFVDERLLLEGIVTGKADITLPAGLADLPSGNVRILSKNARTVYRLPQHNLRLGFNTLDVSLSNTRNSVASRWKIDIADNGDIEGDLSIRDVFNTRTIQGALKLKAIDATLVNSFLAPGETAEGELYGDLRFAGSLEEPLIYGQTGIRKAKLDSTQLPFEMLPSDVGVEFAGNSSTLSGLLKTPKGEIALSGTADWRTLDEGKAVVSAKGVKLRVTVPPSIEFDLTTDARCEASPKLVKLDGSIDIPWARVQISELPPSTVDVSDDVVRVDRPRPKKKEATASIPIESNLFINIGDDVRLDAMGLKARITGNLHVVQSSGALGLTGEVSIPSGYFKAYGQNLIVRRGRFHFVGPVADPLLDLEAIRNPNNTADNVTAGIRVSGTANSPKISVFSDPAKSETETLSYLIRGEGLDPSGDSDNTMITSALINLGLSQGTQAVKSLGDTIGISGLGLDTEGVGDSSQIVVSAYLLPGLKIKYGVGLFESLATLTLRYRVLPRFYVEAVSGVDQALDFLYSFEF